MSYSFKRIATCPMCNSTRLKVKGLRLNQSQGLFPERKKGIAVSVCKCKNCGLIFSNPQPEPVNIQDHYGIPPESYWKPEYFTYNPEQYAATIKTLKEKFGLADGSKTLDIGAGLGKSMLAFADAGFDSYGLEPSETFRKMAIEKMGVNPEKIQLNAIETAEYPDAHFDFISFGAVLEHLYNPATAIEQAVKWLKPGGIIKISVPSSKWLTAKLINFVYKLRCSKFVCNISPMHPPYHLYEFTLKSFQEHAQKHGYKIVHHEYNVCQTFLPGFLSPIVVPFMKWTKTGMEIVVWVVKS